MNIKHLLRYSCCLALAGLLVSSLPVAAQSSAFTYQGRVTFQNYQANGLFDLTFALFDALTGGNQIGSTITMEGTLVTNGLFTVTLDFGSTGFPGADRWLELSVRTNLVGGYTTLAPRQQLTAAPYAVKAAGFTGTVQDSQLSANVALLNSSPTFTGSVSASGFTGSGAGLTSLNAGNISSGTLADARLSSNIPKLNQANTFTGELKATVGGVDFFMVPKGAVVLWSGSEGTIPSGWALCNGANGTPDLRSKFVVGAGTGGSYAVGDTGGTGSHTHTTAIGTPTAASAGAHTHTTTATSTGTGTTGTEAAHTHSVNVGSTTSSTDSHSHSGNTLVFSRELTTGTLDGGGGLYVYLINGTSTQALDPIWGGSTSSDSHNHTVDPGAVTSAAGSSHAHSVPALNIPALATDSQGAHTHTVSVGTITSSSSDSRPPYYALCYIMKL
ncbi:MAG TPA: hypothetical protein PKI20_09860 [Verrucomicrobiota bacterium]|jgi:hypothetical protein|nr:hypothetical protein [Verrucomicrobiota bacterium]HQL77830.1 hypothetical protein [Verrucomicrobiota bacterium]